MTLTGNTTNPTTYSSRKAKFHSQENMRCAAQRRFRVAALRRNGLYVSDSSSDEGDLDSHLSLSDENLLEFEDDGDNISRASHVSESGSRMWRIVDKDGEFVVKQGSLAATPLEGPEDVRRRKRQRLKKLRKKREEALRAKQLGEQGMDPLPASFDCQLMPDSRDNESLDRSCPSVSHDVVDDGNSHCKAIHPNEPLSKRCQSDGQLSPPKMGVMSRYRAKSLDARTFSSVASSPSLSSSHFGSQEIEYASQHQSYPAHASHQSSAMYLLPEYAKTALSANFLITHAGNPALGANRSNDHNRPIGEIIPDFTELHPTLGCHFLRKNVRPGALLSTSDFAFYVCQVTKALEDDSTSVGDTGEHVSNAQKVMEELQARAALQIHKLKHSLTEGANTINTLTENAHAKFVERADVQCNACRSEVKLTVSHKIKAPLRLNAGVDFLGDSGKLVVDLNTMAIGTVKSFRVHEKSRVVMLPELGLDGGNDESAVAALPSPSALVVMNPTYGGGELLRMSSSSASAKISMPSKLVSGKSRGYLERMSQPIRTPEKYFDVHALADANDTSLDEFRGIIACQSSPGVFALMTSTSDGFDDEQIRLTELKNATEDNTGGTIFDTFGESNDSGNNIQGCPPTADTLITEHLPDVASPPKNAITHKSTPMLTSAGSWPGTKADRLQGPKHDLQFIRAHSSNCLSLTPTSPAIESASQSYESLSFVKSMLIDSLPLLPASEDFSNTVEDVDVDLSHSFENMALLNVASETCARETDESQIMTRKRMVQGGGKRGTSLDHFVGEDVVCPESSSVAEFPSRSSLADQSVSQEYYGRKGSVKRSGNSFRNSVVGSLRTEGRADIRPRLSVDPCLCEDIVRLQGNRSFDGPSPTASLIAGHELVVKSRSDQRHQLPVDSSVYILRSSSTASSLSKEMQVSKDGEQSFEQVVEDEYELDKQSHSFAADPILMSRFSFAKSGRGYSSLTVASTKSCSESCDKANMKTSDSLKSALNCSTGSDDADNELSSSAETNMSSIGEPAGISIRLKNYSTALRSVATTAATTDVDSCAEGVSSSNVIATCVGSADIRSDTNNKNSETQVDNGTLSSPMRLAMVKYHPKAAFSLISSPQVTTHSAAEHGNEGTIKNVSAEDLMLVDSTMYGIMPAIPLSAQNLNVQFAVSGESTNKEAGSVKREIMKLNSERQGIFFSENSIHKSVSEVGRLSERPASNDPCVSSMVCTPVRSNSKRQIQEKSSNNGAIPEMKAPAIGRLRGDLDVSSGTRCRPDGAAKGHISCHLDVLVENLTDESFPVSEPPPSQTSLALHAVRSLQKCGDDKALHVKDSIVCKSEMFPRNSDDILSTDERQAVIIVPMPIHQKLLLPMIGNVLAGDENDLSYLDNYMYCSTKHFDWSDAEISRDKCAKERPLAMESTSTPSRAGNSMKNGRRNGNMSPITENDEECPSTPLSSTRQNATKHELPPLGSLTRGELPRESKTTSKEQDILPSRFPSQEYHHPFCAGLFNDDIEDAFCSNPLTDELAQCNFKNAFEAALHVFHAPVAQEREEKREPAAKADPSSEDEIHVDKAKDNVTAPLQQNDAEVEKSSEKIGALEERTRRKSLTKSIKRVINHGWIGVQNITSTFQLEACSPIDLSRYISNRKDRCNVGGHQFRPPVLARQEKLRRESSLGQDYNDIKSVRASGS